jgi:hypothetical protein
LNPRDEEEKNEASRGGSRHPHAVQPAEVARGRSSTPPSAPSSAAHRTAQQAARYRQAKATVSVTWDAKRRRPASFVWRRHRFQIDRVVHTWVVATGWWAEEAQVSRHYWRVQANGRLFDLSFDRLSRVWRLERVVS